MHVGPCHQLVLANLENFWGCQIWSRTRPEKKNSFFMMTLQLMFIFEVRLKYGVCVGHIKLKSWSILQADTKKCQTSPFSIVFFSHAFVSNFDQKAQSEFLDVWKTRTRRCDCIVCKCVKFQLELMMMLDTRSFQRTMRDA